MGGRISLFKIWKMRAMAIAGDHANDWIFLRSGKIEQLIRIFRRIDSASQGPELFARVIRSSCRMSPCRPPRQKGWNSKRPSAQPRPHSERAVRPRAYGASSMTNYNSPYVVLRPLTSDLCWKYDHGPKNPPSERQWPGDLPHTIPAPDALEGRGGSKGI